MIEPSIDRLSSEHRRLCNACETLLCHSLKLATLTLSEADAYRESYLQNPEAAWQELCEGRFKVPFLDKLASLERFNQAMQRGIVILIEACEFHLLDEEKRIEIQFDIPNPTERLEKMLSYVEPIQKAKAVESLLYSAVSLSVLSVEDFRRITTISDIEMRQAEARPYKTIVEIIEHSKRRMQSWIDLGVVEQSEAEELLKITSTDLNYLKDKCWRLGEIDTRYANRLIQLNRLASFLRTKGRSESPEQN